MHPLWTHYMLYATFKARHAILSSAITVFHYLTANGANSLMSPAHLIWGRPHVITIPRGYQVIYQYKCMNYILSKTSKIYSLNLAFGLELFPSGIPEPKLRLRVFLDFKITSLKVHYYTRQNLLQPELNSSDSWEAETWTTTILWTLHASSKQNTSASWAKCASRIHRSEVWILLEANISHIHNPKLY